MKKIQLVISIMLFISFTATASEGLINIESNHSVARTAERLVNILNKKGMTIFNRIKHSESAEKIGVHLRETELIIFGNPKAGSPLMKCQQTIAIDLPQKALVWEDGNNQVWISYNDIDYLKARHSVKGCKKIISKVGKILANISQAAASN